MQQTARVNVVKMSESARRHATWATSFLAILFILLFLIADAQRGQNAAAAKNLAAQLTATLGQQFAEICERPSADRDLLLRSCREDAKKRAREHVQALAGPVKIF